MNKPARNSILCPNCRRLISTDESRCPYCGIKTPGSRIKNNPLTRGWGSGEYVVQIILYVNIAMYLLSLLIDIRGVMSSGHPLLMLTPTRASFEALGSTGTIMVKNYGWWTLISANYLHGGLLHILFNMMAFRQIAPFITKLFGTYRFFAIFTISGIGGYIISYVAGVPLTIGASGALFGLIGAALYYGKSRGGVFGENIYKQLGTWALAFILMGFMIPQINNAAHIGGMVFGGLCGFLFGYNEKTRENLLHRLVAGVCLALTILVLIYSILRGFAFWLL